MQQSGNTLNVLGGLLLFVHPAAAVSLSATHTLKHLARAMFEESGLLVVAGDHKHSQQLAKQHDQGKLLEQGMVVGMENGDSQQAATDQGAMINAGTCPGSFQYRCTWNWGGNACFNNQGSANSCSGPSFSWCALPDAPSSLTSMIPQAGTWCYGDPTPSPCPASFPYQCKLNWDGKACFNNQGYASACSGPEFSWCALPGAPSSLTWMIPQAGTWCSGTVNPTTPAPGTVNPTTPAPATCSCTAKGSSPNFVCTDGFFGNCVGNSVFCVRDGSWTRPLDANSICAFVGQATCSCTAKDQLSAYTCTDGSGGFCQAPSVCKFSGSWNKDSLSASSLCGFVGQATCSCTAKDQLKDWRCTDLSGGSCGGNAVCIASGSWNKDSLSASSLCGFVGQATCSCTAKDQLGAYTCTDGSGGFCQAPSVCTFPGSWNKDSLSASSLCGFVGQATCSCSAPWTTASYTCTDGTVGSCGAGSVCKFAGSWNKDSLSPGALCAFSG